MNRSRYSLPYNNSLGRLVVTARQHGSDFPRRSHNRTDILMTSMFAYRIVRVVYRSSTSRFFDPCPNNLITVTIIDYRITFLAIDESFDEGAAFSSYRDKRMYIRKPGKLDRKCSNCSRAAIYNQR